MIYFMQAGADNGPIKIGWAEDVDARLKQIQTHHHEPLRVLRIIDTPRTAERWLHGRFANRRLGGEWFHFDPDMLAVRPPLPEPKAKSPLVSWAGEKCTPESPCSWCREAARRRQRLIKKYFGRASSA